MNCEKCGDTGWIVRETAGLSAVVQCSCRKQRTAAPVYFEDRQIPLTEDIAAGLIRMLCDDVLAYSPGKLGQALLVSAVMEMCSTQDELNYVVKRASALYREWKACGIPGLRQIVSSFRVPKDGITLLSTDAYPDIAAIKPPAAPPPSFPKLKAGESTTTDRQLESGMQKLLEAQRKEKKLSAVPIQTTAAQRRRDQEFSKTLEDVSTLPEQREPEIPRKAPKQSEVISAHMEPDPVDAPRPAGTYQPITRENFNELLRRELEEKKKKEGA